MSDVGWRYGDARQPTPNSLLAGKRTRSEYDSNAEDNTHTYYPRDDDRGPDRTMIDTESINASYDRYLRESSRPLTGGLSNHSMEDRHLGVDPHAGENHHWGIESRIGNDSRISSMEPMMATKGSNSILGLPPDASSTLYVEGLPSNCTRREVAHIFRPFVGYHEVRLVTKDPKHPGGTPVILCFVDFASPAHAATAMDALQGYKFDEYDRESGVLRLQFARHPGARSSGGGHRGKC